MSKSLPPPRRQAQAYRAGMSTPPRTPLLANDATLPLGPPSVAGSSASGVDALSSTDMDSHYAPFESLGPPGASRRPTRRVRSIERTWQWVKSRSSVYGEAGLLDRTDEEGAGGSAASAGQTPTPTPTTAATATTISDSPTTSFPPLGALDPDDIATTASTPDTAQQQQLHIHQQLQHQLSHPPPGTARPLTVAAMGTASPTDETMSPSPGAAAAARTAARRQSSAGEVDRDERRRRRQGWTPESGLRPPPRPRPASRSFTPPPVGAAGNGGGSGDRGGAASSAASVSSSNGSSGGHPRNVAAYHYDPNPNPAAMANSHSHSNNTHGPHAAAARDRPRPLPIVLPKPGSKVFPGAGPSAASIHDIVKRHSTAVALAEEGVKDRARAELASRPDILLAAARERKRSKSKSVSPTKRSPAATNTTSSGASSTAHTPSPRATSPVKGGGANNTNASTNANANANAAVVSRGGATITPPTPLHNNNKSSRSSNPPPTAGSNRPSHRRDMSLSTNTDTSDTDSVVRDYRLAQAAYDQLTPLSTGAAVAAASSAGAPTTPVMATAAPTPPPTVTPTPTAFTPQARSVLSSPTPEHSPRSKAKYQRDRANMHRDQRERDRGGGDRDRSDRDRDRMQANSASADMDSLERTRSTTSIVRPKSASPLPPDDEAHAMALYLRSPQLNRVIQIPRPYPERPLQVSFADLGKPDGRPVVVFLGLGCVRYLVALYDDLARALGLRLICIDRWGLGKTGQVPQNQRCLLDWADVVRYVLDDLGIERFQIIAHSAGAPYALATVLKMESRVHGKIHLLAPWVGGDPEGYKWLKWVPNTVIKSALAAEWRLESYFLGKAPTIKPVRGKPEAMMSSTSLDSDESRSRTSFAQDTRPESRAGDSGPDGFGTLASDLYSSMPGQTWSGSTSVSSVSSSPGFPQALLQASHAESLSGTTADLLSVVLGRDAKPWGFSYTDIRHPCKIWYGAEDDRVSEKSMRWMERAMDAELIVVQEEGHNLMSSRIVMFDVLDSLAEDI